MKTRTHFMTEIVRPIALAWVCVTFGSLVALVLKITIDLQISKLTASAISFIVGGFCAFALFPKILKQPFGAVGLSTYLRRLGFYLPKRAWKHILLGLLLAVLTLCGMLVGSLLTGRYVFNPDTVNITQILFSLNPGIWEEFFFRGVIMFICIRLMASVRRAAMLQILLFGLAHIKGMDLWSWVDVLSVMIIAVAFTYTAWKTRTLVAGIVFHFLHDAFLFVPQLPGAETTSTAENLAFFGCLWISVGLSIMLVKLASERLGVMAVDELYKFEDVISN